MSLSGSFSYVLIPADPALPLELQEGDKSGGLSDDALVKDAKSYFERRGDASGRAAALAAIDTYNPQERKALAQSVRQQMITNNPNVESQINQMQDDALLELVKATENSSSVEISALTVPTQANQYMAVSMYCSDKSQNLPVNPRATALLEACGHNAPEGGVRGNVFVGRCHDKEDTDVWERVDFTIEDASPDAPWCTVARSKGGGGGTGKGGTPASLSGVMSQAFSSQQESSATSSSQEEGYTWSQNDEEVELKFSVAPGTKAKYVKVAFSRNNLKVTVAGQTLVNGPTGGNVDVGDCTYTIQDEDTGRELCITLGKKDAGVTWPFPVQRKG